MRSLFLQPIWRFAMGAVVFVGGSMAGVSAFAQGHGGHGGHSGGHMAGGPMGGAHHSGHYHGGHHHSGVGISVGGIGIGIGYGGFGYGGLGYGGLGYSGFGISSYPYGYGYRYGAPFGYVPYGYSVPAVRVPSYRYASPMVYSVPSYSVRSNTSVVVSRPRSNVWDGVSDLKPGMVLPDGAIVVSVGPSKPVEKSEAQPAEEDVLAKPQSEPK